MASATAVTSTAQASTTGSTDVQPLSSIARGGGRGGQGGSRGTQPRSSRGARGNGRNRGNQSRGHNNQRQRRVSTVENRPPPSLPPPPGLGGGGSFGDRPTKDAETKEGERLVQEQDDNEDDVEAEVCFICASPVVHNSVAPCNHRTCHICALRLRALYKTRACAHCRTEAKYVIFTDDTTKRYEDFQDSDFGKIDETLGILYEKSEIHSDTLLLLRYNCPDSTCDIACYGWPDLHRHVKSVHHKIMCDLCTRNKKVFTHEHELFTQQELRKHEKFGDDNPGAIDQSGFVGHPECGFCRQRFYGDDELYTHCRDKHEKCHICDRRNQGRQQQYYLDYNSLEQHFRQDHFLCADQECLDKKFVVFESEMDLKAHQLDAHPNGLSKDARRDARRVDISAFDYRTPHQETRGARGGREGRSRGRGRDPNTEPLPQSTAQPLRRDELAYQRQMAIQSAQSVTTRTFGGQLTSTDAYAARPSNRQEEPATVTAPRGPPTTSLPPVENLRLDVNPPAEAQLSPQEQARRLRHASVIERASVLLKNDQSKVASFRSTVSSYRTSAITASQLIDTTFSLFDAPSNDVGKLIKELADIYENEAKRNELLKAWNDWRAINEDYPTLPGPSGILPGSSSATTSSGGHRVLRLKSSTAQSSRSAANKNSSWGHTASASNPIPSVPAASASVNRAGAGRVGVTPWTAPSAVPSSRTAPVTSSPSSKALQPSTASHPSAFPALPAAAKPNTLMAGKTRGTVRWDDGRSNHVVNPWGNSVRANSPNPPLGDEDGGLSVIDGEIPETNSKKKGAKAKKQTLYKFG